MHRATSPSVIQDSSLLAAPPLATIKEDDKLKKRLARKAELARASRRRKKAYVSDLEARLAQLTQLLKFYENENEKGNVVSKSDVELFLANNSNYTQNIEENSKKQKRRYVLSKRMNSQHNHSITNENEIHHNEHDDSTTETDLSDDINQNFEISTKSTMIHPSLIIKDKMHQPEFKSTNYARKGKQQQQSICTTQSDTSSSDQHSSPLKKSTKVEYNSNNENKEIISQSQPNSQHNIAVTAHFQTQSIQFTCSKSYINLLNELEMRLNIFPSQLYTIKYKTRSNQFRSICSEEDLICALQLIDSNANTYADGIKNFASEQPSPLLLLSSISLETNSAQFDSFSIVKTPITSHFEIYIEQTNVQKTESNSSSRRGSRRSSTISSIAECESVKKRRMSNWNMENVNFSCKHSDVVPSQNYHLNANSNALQPGNLNNLPNPGCINNPITFGRSVSEDMSALNVFTQYYLPVIKPEQINRNSNPRIVHVYVELLDLSPQFCEKMDKLPAGSYENILNQVVTSCAFVAISLSDSLQSVKIQLCQLAKINPDNFVLCSNFYGIENAMESMLTLQDLKIDINGSLQLCHQKLIQPLQHYNLHRQIILAQSKIEDSSVAVEQPTEDLPTCTYNGIETLAHVAEQQIG